MKKLNVILMLLLALTFAAPATLTFAAANVSENHSKMMADKVNINTADEATLAQVPGIGPKTAGKIRDYRDQNGKFEKIEDLTNVKGIGDKSLEKMKPYLTI